MMVMAVMDNLNLDVLLPQMCLAWNKIMFHSKINRLIVYETMKGFDRLNRECLFH